MDPCPDEETILAFVGGRLSSAGIELLEHHADACAACVELIAAAAQDLAREPPPVTPGGAPGDLAQEPGSGLGKYRVLGSLGHGGMGDVHRAVELASGRLVALKRVRAGTPSARHARHALASILREIHALRRIQHPGVACILDQGICDGSPWYTMELIEGETLSARLAALQWARAEAGGGAEPVTLQAEIFAILRGLCETLSFLHGEGIVHGDLTPRNVVVRPGGAPILVDFGLAIRHDRLARGFLESGAFAAGTPEYIAPEQLRGEQGDPRTDLYALGCILYQTVVGQPPFASGPRDRRALRHLDEIPVPPSTRVKGIPPALDALILCLLEKRPRDRFGCAEDVAAALAPFSSPVIRTVASRRPRPYVYQPALEGRDELLASLDRLLALCCSGRGARVFVGGGSGIGKTRVLAEVASRARARGLRVIVGECVALSTKPRRDTERSSALHPFLPVLQAIVDACGPSPELAERLLGPRGRVLAAYEPELRELPGQDAYPPPPLLSAQAARYQLLGALQETIAALAAEGPLLLVLDDLQWADDLSLDLLETLPPDFCEQRGIVVIGAYRSEETSAHLERVVHAPGALTMPLGRLGASSIARMVGDMLAQDDAPRELLEPLAAASEGNPFFVAEYLRMAIDEGWLRREIGGAYAFAVSGRDPRVQTLPGSLRELIGRRIDALGVQSRHLIEIGSILGREFERDLLLATAELTCTLGMDALRELVTRHLLEEVSSERLRFVHDKQREVVYEQMPEARLRELHRRAAVAIDARYGPVIPPLLYGTLAHHWASAGARHQAIDYLERAGERALGTAAYAEAAGFFQRALEVDRERLGANGERADLERPARWQRLLGEAHYGLGDLSRCALHSSVALAGFGHPLPRSQAGWILELGLQIGIQLRHLASPRSDAERSPEGRARLEEASLAAARIAHHYYFAHEAVELMAVSLLSVNLAERALAEEQLTRPYAQLGYFSGIAGLRALSSSYFAQARRNAEAAGDPSELAIAMYHEATFHVGEGAWERSLTTGTRSLELLEECGNRQESEIVHTVLAHAEYCMGRYRDSLARCKIVSDSAHARANTQHEAWGLYTGARSLIRLGRLGEARVRLESALSLLRKRPELPSELLCFGLTALVHLHEGDLASAEGAADQALDRMERRSSPTIFSVGDGHAAVAKVYLTLWERASGLRPGAVKSLSERAGRALSALRRFARVFPIGQPDVRLTSGRIDLLRGNESRAAQHFRCAAESAHALSMPYEEATARLLLARLQGQDEQERNSHLPAARRAFERLGCIHDLRRIQENEDVRS